MDFNKEKWNKFVIENNGLFLQSWEWGEFQRSLGRKIWWLKENENWQALVIKYDLPLSKNYLYCPGGPVMKYIISLPSSVEEGVGGGVDIKNQHPSLILPSSEERKNTDDLREFLKQAKEIAKQEKSIFLKIETFSKIMEAKLPYGSLASMLANQGFKKSDGGQRILKTLILDLGKSEDQLLAEMKQKTRYNIKLSQKRGVSVKVISNFPIAKSDTPKGRFPLNRGTITGEADLISKKYLNEFLKLTRIKCKREKKRSHSEMHYMAMVEVMGENNLKLFIAEYEDRIIAANIVMFFGNRAVYLHGASSNECRNLMAPYLLQWEQIKEAKKQGCEIYDFWGIDEKKWPGVTRFKKGFGGEEIDYSGTFDFIFDKTWYEIYKIAKRII